ncbi:TrgA family protein [Rhodobacter capsulatus]|uniref:TrgA family protein n=1 Tax=Rhodobacter capsulatus TaxID=1061 RepID=A0A4U1JU61_RHOCA|nr:TrgA family protein [Rhodobacter capsulatus]TKD22757.1 TrgA family protein [Rhodobacter capsulatus]
MQKVVVRDTQMSLPTTAKLFGALGLAATGFITAELIPGNLPPGTAVHGLALMAASFGLLLGWRVIGRNPGRGRVKVVERGLHAAIYLLLWTLVFLGALQMMREMARGRYDSPSEALLDVLAQGMRLGAEALRLDVLGTLFCGAVLSAMLAEWAWKRWH